MVRGIIEKLEFPSNFLGTFPTKVTIFQMPWDSFLFIRYETFAREKGRERGCCFIGKWKVKVGRKEIIILRSFI